MRQDIAREARAAIKAVVDRLERPERRVCDVVIKPKLVVRGTTAPPRPD